MRQFSLKAFLSPTLVFCLLLTSFTAEGAVYDVSGIPEKNTGDAITAAEVNLIVDMLRNLRKDDQGDADVTNDRIGIGITGAPSYMLDVNGTVNASAFIGDGSQLTNLPNPGLWQETASDIYFNTGKVAIGINSSPTYELEVHDNADSDIQINAGGSGNDASLRLKNDTQEWVIRNNGGATDNFQITNITSGNTAFDIDSSSNNVTISSELTVNDNITSTGIIYATEFYDTDTGAPVSGLGLWEEGAEGSEIYYDADNIGIGIQNPDFPLHVVGNTRLEDAVAIGATSSFNTDRVVNIDQNFSTDVNNFLLMAQGTASGVTTGNKTFRGGYIDVESDQTESGGNNYTEGLYTRARTSGSATFNSIRGLNATAFNDSNAAGVGSVVGIRGEAYNNDTTATVGSAYGSYAIARGGSVAPAGNVTNLYGTYGQAAAYESNVTNAFGAYNYARTVDGDGGDIDNAYGSYNRVRVDSAAGGNIDDAYGVYSLLEGRTGSNEFSTATGVYADVNNALTAYGGRFYANDPIANLNYGIVVGASGATNNYGIFGTDGDWVLDADGDGALGGSGSELIIGEDADLKLFHDGTNSVIENETGNLVLQNNGSGNVGIGTSSPGAELEVNGNVLATRFDLAEGSLRSGVGEFLITNNNGFPYFRFRDKGVATIYNENRSLGNFVTSPVLNIGQSNAAGYGSLGIGLADGENPGDYLSRGSHRGLVIKGLSNGHSAEIVMNNNSANTQGGFITFTHGGSDALTDELQGQVGIFNDVSDGFVNGGRFGVLTGKNGFIAERLSVTRDGNVGIGNTNPSEELFLKRDQSDSTTAVVQNSSAGTGANVRSNLALSANGAQMDMSVYGTGATGTLSGVSKSDAAFLRTALGAPVSSLNIGNGGAAPINFITNDQAQVTINAAGNLGIGTTGPSSSLTITNSVNDAGFTMNTLNGRIYQGYGGGQNRLVIGEKNGGTGSAALFLNGDDGDVSGYDYASIIHSGSTGDLVISNSDNGGAWTQADILLNPSRSVGIGDTTPDGTLKLDVEGQIGATEFCDENGNNCTAAAALGSGYWSKTGDDVWYNPGAVGEVGIGISNPSEELTVSRNQTSPTTIAVQNSSAGTGTTVRAGVALQSNSNTVDLMTYGSGATGTIGGQNRADSAFLRTASGNPVDTLNVGTGSANDLNLFTDDTTRLTVDGSTGNVGIGTTEPNNKLQVEGLIEFNDATYTTLLGSGAGANMATTGNLRNTAVGYQALNSNTTGFYNTANGAWALSSNTTGSYNTAMGLWALRSNTTGNYNTANGPFALRSNTTGNYNTANGLYALQSNTTGYYNTANGPFALQSNTTGNQNTANGPFALQYNTTGNYNTANGFRALQSNTTGRYNTANGMHALHSNTTGNNNTANGFFALHSNTTGNNNTANGMQALEYNTTGHNNTANGMYALQSNTTGINNTANGLSALSSNTTGNYNTANGFGALSYNTTGNYNTANGNEALVSNTTGIYNTANGAWALSSNTTGSNNTANGMWALNLNTTGFNNTALGHNTGGGISTGSYNTILGANVVGLPAALSNNIIIADGQGNQRIRVNSIGNVGVGTTSPTHRLHVSGQARIPEVVFEPNNNGASDKTSILGGSGTMQLFADGSIDLYESDANTRQFRFNVNNGNFDFAGNLRTTSGELKCPTGQVMVGFNTAGIMCEDPTLAYN